MTKRFELSISPSALWCLQSQNYTHEEHWYLRRAVWDNFMDSVFYKAKQKARPFLQSGSENKQGWLLVEFWCESKLTAQEYVDFLNENFGREVMAAKNAGILDFDLKCG